VSKSIYFLSLFLFSTLIDAKSNLKIHVTLESTNKKGDFRSTNSMVLDSGKVRINGTTISDQQVIALVEKIRFITYTQPNQAINSCYSGTYSLKVLKNDILKNEIGCLESERYKNLNQSFSDLEKNIFLDPVKQKK
jgi:hypothetical protein